MHRLFVALRPPAPFRERLLAIMGGIAGARWQDDDQLHLTLRFIGEVERPVAEDIAFALGRVDGPQPIVALRGVGTFGRQERVHTLWAGIAPNEGLALLKKRVDRALTAVGLVPDPRAFAPHVTIARFGRSGGSCEAFISRHAALASDPMPIASMSLFESSLGRDGATYETIARYSLR